jgi:uncharacterized protein (DUF983 family)
MALSLRCPRCGAGGILDGWFKLKETCSRCSLSLRDAAEEDEWFGGLFMNLIAAESLMIAVVLAYVWWTWPAVSWTRVEVLAIVLAVVLPVVTYPFAKALWVAVEFVFAERALTKSGRRS